ncbi:chaperone protein dnaJ 49-like [Actinidia eriantha]|uniref:chaperone protein dnaJ 49-like n=1 Tax=Actinidia eriantha TaxID=165200 RepID=UPI00258EFF10|nr:chaperone protein dnaJ 49-like [Actinidia eriantha]XP_057501617.1 chaperone protein dnaJ 49-like [Actinidia eriantha]
MEGNKDEALKCLKIGRGAIESGDRVRALKFITKARRLDPSLAIDDLLSKLEDQPSNKPTNESSSSPDSTKESNKTNVNSGPKRRVSASGSSSSSAPVAYTEEQISIVREIKGKKDYYEILGIEKNCSDDDVKKAYRKLSLKVHPDKNKAPGAEEAFKKVSKAFQCLSVEESRKKYDVVGSDDDVYQNHGRQARGFNGFYEADIDANEIFRNFFFGGMNPGVATQFGTFSFGGPGVGVRTRTGNNGSNGMARTLIQLLPVLLILVLNFLPSSEPIYALSRTYSHAHQVTTERGVNFYVKSARFEHDYPPDSGERVALERRVERDYVSILAQNCRVELQHFRWGLVRETPNCDALKQFEAEA